MNTNLLQNEKSPYLLQHAGNPIAWRPWGQAAFDEARKSGKPIFLSVGYSTCHWCHVMAHESFEDQEVAQVLNEHFVSIKVDREERPDVDQIYMSALQALSGGGGWPMSVWLTADGKPFFAGTYFPKYRFLQLLRRIQEIWSSEPDKLSADADRLMGTMRDIEKGEAHESNAAEFEQFLKAYTTHFQHHFDEANGGFGGRPKFPQTMNLMVMMRQDFKSGLHQAEAMVSTTLNKMIRGGIYDHLAGGFHRYSVDEKWLVPHFEKMLYDQAMITNTLLDAFQLYGGDELARAARETLDYVLREMTHAQGGFFSAQDADSLNPVTSEKDEGYFCTFEYSELRNRVTADELAALERVYGVTPAGHYEGRSILHLQEGYDGTEKEQPLLQSAFAKLRELRAARPAPHLDDKVITAWNGWMIWAMVRGGLALEERRYLEAAEKGLKFIRENLWANGSLHRFSREGEAKGRGTAEDYASVIHACLEMYQADFNPQWAEWALELQQSLDQHFWDTDEGLYFANDGHDPLLPYRPKDQYDGVHPSSNSLAAYNLVRLHLLTGEPKFNHQFERIAAALFGRLGQYPSSLAFMALALDAHVSHVKVAVVAGGREAEEELKRARTQFQPHTYWAWSATKWPVTLGKTGEGIYICEAGTCYLKTPP